MGNMVTVTILTDCWDQMRKDPQKFVDAIHEGISDPHGRHCRYNQYGGGLKVMPWRHADNVGIFYTNHNSTIELSKYNPETQELLQRNESMRDLLRQAIRDTRWFVDELEEQVNHVTQISATEDPKEYEK
jgi:hypothetical protein